MAGLLLEICGWFIAGDMWLVYCWRYVAGSLLEMCGWFIAGDMWLAHCWRYVAGLLLEICGWFTAGDMWLVCCWRYVAGLLLGICGWFITGEMWLVYCWRYAAGLLLEICGWPLILPVPWASDHSQRAGCGEGKVMKPSKVTPRCQPPGASVAATCVTSPHCGYSSQQVEGVDKLNPLKS